MAATSPEQAVVHTNMEEWLTSLRLQEYAPAFAAQSVELANTGCIDDAMLDKVGITKLGHRKRFLKSTKTQADAGFTTPWTAPAAAPEPAAAPAQPAPAQPAEPVVDPGASKPPINNPFAAAIAAKAPAPPDEAPPPKPQKKAPSPAAKPKGIDSKDEYIEIEEVPGKPSPPKPAPRRRSESPEKGAAPVPSPRPKKTESPVKAAGEAAVPPVPAPRPAHSRDASGVSQPSHSRGASVDLSADKKAESEGDDDGDDDEEDDGIYVTLPIKPTAASRPVSVIRTHEPPPMNQVFDLPDSRANTLLGNVSVDSSTKQLMETATAKGPRMVNLVSKSIDSRTKQGWLGKKGGKLGNKGWDRRFFKFQEGELTYYITEKDKTPQGTILLKDMAIVRPSKVTDRHAFRFELETRERTYYFNAESAQDMTEWMMLLGAAIQMFVPSSNEVVGGAMANPDKAGWIKKQANNTRGGWNRRYLAIKDGTLCYYQKYEDFEQDNPVQSIDTLLVTVKIGQGGKKAKHHQFQLVTRQRNYEFQAETHEEMMSWTQAIQNSILWSLNQNTSVKSNLRPSTETIPPEKVLELLRENRDNLMCADCGAANPDWASISLGVLLCINCSGIHRSLGVHISKVRSSTLDEWTPTLIGLVKSIATVKSNIFWEGKVENHKITQHAQREDREVYIRDKYEHKKYLDYSLESMDDLDAQLLANVKTDNLIKTIELITAGASRDLIDPETSFSVVKTAKAADQLLQAELLLLNGFTLTPEEQKEEPAVVLVKPKPKVKTDFQSFLHKRGHQNTDWKRRWFKYKLGELRYFKTDVDDEPAGLVTIESILSVTVNDEESAKDPAYQFCFDIETADRTYILSAETEQLRTDWIKLLDSNVKALPVGSRRTTFNLALCIKTGYLEKRGQNNPAYKKRFFALRGKDLFYFHSESELEELGSVDLRGKQEVGIDESASEGEHVFFIKKEDRTWTFRAENRQDMQAWVAAIGDTQVFGAPLLSSKYVVPTVVEKCLRFIEQTGLFTEGIYRVPGNLAAMRELRAQFDTNDKGVEFDTESHSCHDIAGLLKLYFRELPEPILTSEVLPKVIQACQLPDHNTKLFAIQDLINTLPLTNYETLKRMCAHLSLVSQHEESNKMSLNNLSLVFGPTLIAPKESLANIGAGVKVVDIIVTYHEWIFSVAEKTETELNIQEGLKRLEAAKLGRTSNGTIDAPFIHEIFYESTKQSLTIPITSSMTAKDVVKLVVEKGEYQPCSTYSLVECLDDDDLERDLEDDELVFEATAQWKTGGKFRLRDCPNKTLRTVATSHPMRSWVHHKTKKGWKNFYFACDLRKCTNTPGTLFYHKDEFHAAEIGSFPLRDTQAYRAFHIKKSPHDYCFALRLSDGTTQYFSVETEILMNRWLACLRVGRDPAKYPVPPPQPK